MLLANEHTIVRAVLLITYTLSSILFTITLFLKLDSAEPQAQLNFFFKRMGSVQIGLIVLF